MSTFLNINYLFTNEDNSETITFSDTTDYALTGKLVLLYSMPKGLHDSELRQDEFFLASTDGVRTGDMYLGKRVITFDATLVATTENNMNSLIDDFRKVFVPLIDIGLDKTYHTLSFTDIDGIAKNIKYQIHTSPQFTKQVNHQMEVPCIFSIKCDNPRYYSDAETTTTLNLAQIVGGIQFDATSQFPCQFATAQTGGDTNTNAGNYPAYPTITIYGPCTNPIVTNVTTNESLKYEVTLAIGSIIVCNCETGETTKNGSDNTGELADDSIFPKLIPGSNYWVFTDDTLNATGECDITYNSVWI